VEELVPNGMLVKSLSDNMIYKIVDAIKTDNQFGYGMYLYRFENKLDTGFGLYRHEFEVLNRDCNDAFIPIMNLPKKITRNEYYEKHPRTLKRK